MREAACERGGTREAAHERGGARAIALKQTA